MTITVVCTSCGRQFEAPSDFVGRRVKCKNCGTVFQVQAPKSGDAEIDSQFEALEQLEKTAGGTEIDPSDGSTVIKSRLVPRDEKRLKANPQADEIPVTAPPQAYGRPNVMSFRYPGARQVDQWLPLGLLLLGLIGFAAVVAGSRDTNDLTWIGISRFAIFVLFYYAIIFPITLAMLGKAGREMHYRPPPNFKLRTFATYMPAFALSACFWFAGNGSLMGLILGALFGLALSSGALWILFRLREEELATSVSYGAGGFALGACICIGLIFGLNFLSALIVTQAKSQAKFPASPFSPGLAWAAPLPQAPVVKKAPPVVVVNNDTPVVNSPVVSEIHNAKIPFPVDTIVRPLSPSAIVGVLHSADNFLRVEPWNTETLERQPGNELQVSLQTGKVPRSDEYAISTDGTLVAWIAERPRLSAQIWSFATGHVQMLLLDLDHSLGTPHLLGFSAPNTLFVRWEKAPDPSDPKPGPDASLLKTWKLQALDTDKRSAADPIDLPPMADSPASIAVNIKSQRLVAVGVINSTSSLVQYDLKTGQPVWTTNIDEIDPATAAAPTGMAYSANGENLAVLFEYPGGALLLYYDAKTGKKIHDSVYTAWPPAGITPAGFKNHQENAIAWIDSSNLLLYGQGILDSKSGNIVATLSVPGVAGQRVLDNGAIELLTDDARKITVVTLDQAKLNAILNPPPAAQ